MYYNNRSYINHLFTICSSFKGLKLNTLGVEKILSTDYVKVLLSFKAAKLQEYKGFFNVKFGLSKQAELNSPWGTLVTHCTKIPLGWSSSTSLPSPCRRT